VGAKHGKQFRLGNLGLCGWKELEQCLELSFLCWALCSLHRQLEHLDQCLS
jgi:hypothetical protein